MVSGDSRYWEGQEAALASVLRQRLVTSGGRQTSPLRTPVFRPEGYILQELWDGQLQGRDSHRGCPRQGESAGHDHTGTRDHSGVTETLRPLTAVDVM